MSKLGLIAGGGSLPVEIADHCEKSGRPLFVIRLKGFAGPELNDYDGVDVGLAEFGKCFRSLKRARCEAVCLAGNVSRPDFRTFMPDLRGVVFLPSLIAAAPRSSGRVLRSVPFGAFPTAVRTADTITASFIISHPASRMNDK